MEALSVRLFQYLSADPDRPPPSTLDGTFPCLNGHVSDRGSAAPGAIEQVADYAAAVSSADQILSAPIAAACPRHCARDKVNDLEAVRIALDRAVVEPDLAV